MSVTFEWREMEAAGPLSTSPLPLFRAADPDGNAIRGEHMTDEEAVGFNDNCGFRILPYLSQDRYDRDVKPRKIPVVVLENEHLRALVLASCGGRLWSLYDKDKKREVFFRNPVIQPCNLAIRDAWLSGGVEWNIGQLGHTFFTCSPVFCARVTDRNGEPFLRLYEYERQKKLFWQVDLHLPRDARQLYYHVRIVNDGEATPMYWWTNTAVTEEPDTRVFMPGDRTLHRRPDRRGNTQDMGKMPFFPSISDKDLSYSANLPRSNDFFVQIPETVAAPWEAAAYADGRVTFERSTALLHYRKMFSWGDLPGGRRWKDFLAREGEGSYLEIQAGIARSQLHGITMPAHTVWRFSAAMGTFDADPSRTHGVPWQEGVDYLSDRVEDEVSADALAAVDARLTAAETAAPDEILFSGSGWGALEAASGRAIPAGLCFPADTMGEEQAPWLSLLRDGVLPAAAPVSYMTDPAWEARIAAAPDGWQKWYHLGVCAVEALRRDEAIDCFRRAVALDRNVWDLRALAALTDDRALYAEVMAMGVPDVAFAQEYLELLLRQGDAAAVCGAYAALPEAFRKNERAQLTAVKAELVLGRTDLCDGGFFDRPFVDIREGETSLSDLWYRWQAILAARKEGGDPETLLPALRRSLTPPYAVDFRMSLE